MGFNVYLYWKIGSALAVIFFMKFIDFIIELMPWCNL
jgi:hypothetical protein